MSDQVAAVVIALLGGGGFVAIVQWALKRRAAQVDDRAHNSVEVAKINASTADKNLDRMFEQMNARIAGYEKSIRDMQSTYAQGQAKSEAEIAKLERKVEDLSTSLRDWQLGNNTPRGQVLIPLREVRRLREAHAGLLSEPWYPGEDGGYGSARGITAHITPLDPQPPEQP